jgi:hypothetical protein
MNQLSIEIVSSFIENECAAGRLCVAAEFRNFVRTVCVAISTVCRQDVRWHLNFASECSEVANSFDLCCQTITEIQTEVPNPRSVSALLYRLSFSASFEISRFYPFLREFIADNILNSNCLAFLAIVVIRIDEEGGNIWSLFGINVVYILNS